MNGGLRPSSSWGCKQVWENREESGEELTGSGVQVILSLSYHRFEEFHSYCQNYLWPVALLEPTCCLGTLIWEG